MVHINVFLGFLGICAALLLFGFTYAYLIARRPFPPKWTWASVAIGDLITDLGTAGQILLLSGDPVLAVLPFINHLLTGGPMILGQLLKHYLQSDGGVISIGDDDGDGA